MSRKFTPMLSGFLGTLLEDAQNHENEEAFSDDREERDVGTIYTCPLATFEVAERECATFAAAIEAHKLAVPDGALADFDPDWHAEQLGSDLYLERAGHGAGFYDRDSWSDDRDENDAIAETLSGLVKSGLETYLGDDGRLYVCGAEWGSIEHIRERYKEAGRCVYGGEEPKGEALARAYIYHRENGRAPAVALSLAKGDSNAKQSRWPRRYTWKAYGAATEDGARYVENPESLGFRFVRWCDELVRSISHKGWFLDDDGITGETNRGAVYLMTHNRYVAGYVDSHNPDGARIWLNEIFKDEDDAARMADEHARIAAEKERDYQRAWREGQDAAEAGKKASNPYICEPERSAWQEGFDNAD